LDAQYPVERLEYMLNDAGVCIVVTQTALGAVPGKVSEQLVVVALDELRERDDEQSKKDLVNVTESGNAAYVIYTSGSTGLPKGVSVTHRNVVNFLTSMSREPGISQLDTWLAVTTLSFDIAALEIWLPLITGARLVIASRQSAADPTELARLLLTHEITVMQATPATWRMLLENGWQGQQALKVLCGGEALTRELSNSLTPRVAQVWNLYGPTETTIWSSVQRMKDEQGAVSIGAPILNTQLYVLDANLQPSPFGVPGELYIGGEGVARGYWQRADLTAEKFIPDPYSDRAGSRLYRTGDVARRQPDGSLLFIGRADHQVKVRGYRIETGEIEIVLRRHEAIQECVVTVRADAGREPYLIAYCTGTEMRPASDELRAHLRSKLPEYMIPAIYLWLDQFPLTLNGKINRRALPAPDGGQFGSGKEYVAPHTELEEQLALVWSEVLGVQRVGINDNFFELGGHSLLATQVVSRIRKAVKKDFPLRLIFEHPTIAALSHALSKEELAGASAESALPETISRSEFMLDELLAELDGLSEDEVRLLLAEESVIPLEGAVNNE
jgi:amino acid adenylation domain-containing protein